MRDFSQDENCCLKHTRNDRTDINSGRIIANNVESSDDSIRHDH